MDAANKVHPALIRAVSQHGVDPEVVLVSAAEIRDLWIAAVAEPAGVNVNTRRLLDLALLGLTLERGQIPPEALLTGLPGLP